MSSSFEELADRLADPGLTRLLTPERRPEGATRAAVLLLLSDTDEPDLLFTERSPYLRRHAGQISFPGGGYEDGDADAAATALRETHEEVGLEPEQITVIGQLPDTRLPVSSFDVAPVVGVWSGTAQLHLASPNEVAALHRWTIADLVAPANRLTALHPGGTRGPAWQFGESFLWGFTAFLTDALLDLGGWTQPWDRSREVVVPRRFRRDRQPE